MKTELKNKIFAAIAHDENYLAIEDTCKVYKWKFAIGDLTNVAYQKSGKNQYLQFTFNCSYTEANGNVTNTVENFRIQIGLQTKSGYFSNKKLPISFVNEDSLTGEELEAAMQYYNKDIKTGSFDPFFTENNYIRKNAAGWVAVAQKLQPDCR